MTVTHRYPAGIVAALRADDLVDLFLHQLGKDAEPDTDAECQEPLPRNPDELPQRLLHPWRQHSLRSDHGLPERYGLPHGGSSFDLWSDHPERSQPERTRQEGPPTTKFYELRDNLPTSGRCAHDLASHLGRDRTPAANPVARGGTRQRVRPLSTLVRH